MKNSDRGVPPSGIRERVPSGTADGQGPTGDALVAAATRASDGVLTRSFGATAWAWRTAITIVIFTLAAAVCLGAPQVTGSIEVSPAGVLIWKASQPARLFMSADGGREILLGEAPEATFQPGWPAPGHTYFLTLRAAAGPGGPETTLDAVSYRRERSGTVTVTRPGVAPRQPWWPFLLAALLPAALVFLATRRAWLLALAARSGIDFYLAVPLAAAAALFSLAFFKGYFFGDSLALILFRPGSLRGIASVFYHVGTWHRPLSQALLDSLLFPVFGLRFAFYHAFMLVLHLGLVALFYTQLRKFVADRLAVFAGTLFFALHSINFYTTYDIAFAPDILLAFFYLLAVGLFFRRRVALACVSFLLALWSKETAVSAPVLIACLIALVPELRVCWKSSARRLAPLVVILAGYVLAQVTRFNAARRAVTSVAPADYVLRPNTLLENASRFYHWVFQIPDGWVTEAWNANAPFLQIAYVFAFLAAAFLVVETVRGNTKVTAGMAWFFVTAFPSLLLGEKYLPHHVYLPLMGMALIVAELFAVVRPRVPAWAFHSLLVLLLANHAWTAVANVRQDVTRSWVGQSAAETERTTAFIRDHAARIRAASTVYLVNKTGAEADFSSTQRGVLGRLAGVPNIEVRAVSKDSALPTPLPDTALALEYGLAGLSEFRPEAPPVETSLTISPAGELSWRAGVPVLLVVKTPDDPEKLISEAQSGNEKLDWLAPGVPFQFRLRALQDGVPGPVLAAVSYQARAPGTTAVITPIPAEQVDSADVSTGHVRVTLNGEVIWKAGQDAQVLVSVDGARERLVAYSPEGSIRVNWLAPKHRYRFVLRAFRDGKPGQVIDAFEYRRDAGGKPTLIAGDGNTRPGGQRLLLLVIGAISAAGGLAGVWLAGRARRTSQVAPAG